MERGKAKHSPREDDELKHESRGTLVVKIFAALNDWVNLN
jgi:hypothetical protein